MPYKKRIAILEESCKVLESKITEAQRNPDFDKNMLNDLFTQRNNLYRSLSDFRRMQWEEDHERVNMDEDR